MAVNPFQPDIAQDTFNNTHISRWLWSGNVKERVVWSKYDNIYTARKASKRMKAFVDRLKKEEMPVRGWVTLSWGDTWYSIWSWVEERDSNKTDQLIEHQMSIFEERRQFSNGDEMVKLTKGRARIILKRLGIEVRGEKEP